MAANTVSTTTINPWQTIATITVTATTSNTVITSLSGYKTLMIVWNSVFNASADSPLIQFNGVTSGYSSISTGIGGSLAATNGIILNSYNYSGQTNIGYLVINDVLSSVPKTVNGYGQVATSTYAGPIYGFWNNTSAITSINFTTQGGTAFSAGGTVTLYGIAA